MKHELPDTRLSQRLLDLRVNVITADRRSVIQREYQPVQVRHYRAASPNDGYQSQTHPPRFPSLD